MMMETEKIVHAAMRLPRESRALLAEKLLESLDQQEGFDVSPGWIREIRRRCEELDDARVNLVPAEEVFEEISRDLR